MHALVAESPVGLYVHGWRRLGFAGLGSRQAKQVYGGAAWNWAREAAGKSERQICEVVVGRVEATRRRLAGAGGEIRIGEERGVRWPDCWVDCVYRTRPIGGS